MRGRIGVQWPLFVAAGAVSPGVDGWERRLETSQEEIRSRAGWLRRAGLGLACWTAVGLVFAASAHLRMPRARWMDTLAAVMPQVYAWALVTPLIFAAMPPFGRVRSHVPIALALMTIAVSIDYVVQKERRAGGMAGGAGGEACKRQRDSRGMDRRRCSERTDERTRPGRWGVDGDAAAARSRAHWEVRHDF